MGGLAPESVAMPERISRSGLWKIQQDYYRALGVDAWDDKTPYYVTNSQIICATYADLIRAFLLDHPVDLEQRLYLLELGSGTGRFGYQLVRELQRKLSFFPRLRNLRFTLVLSDIVEANVLFWEQHPRMAELGDCIDFALMEPGAEGSVALRRSGVVLEKLGNPLIVLANYVFDSIPHDEFRIVAGHTEECLIEIVPRPGGSHSSPDRLDVRDVDICRSYRSVDASSYYEGGRAAEVLKHYAKTVKDGSVTVPVAALDLIDGLRRLGQLVLLSSDRGFTTQDAMDVYPDHPLALHDGCFSHMVNYHGLGLSFESVLFTQRQLVDGVQTVCFSDFPAGPQLQYAFCEGLERTDAVNNITELFALLRDRPPFKALLGFVRLNLSDANAFSAVARRLSENLEGLSYSEHQEVVRTLELVWESDYFFRGSPNVTFWLAHLYACLGLFDRALSFYDLTIERQGMDPMLLYLKGSCWQAAGKERLACALYEQALKLQPGMPEALKALSFLRGGQG